MKQVKVFVEDVAQGMGIDQTANSWLEAMEDSIQVESIQVSIAASGTAKAVEGERAWPVAIMVVYQSKD
ncbi:MAG: hypothetical protein M3Y56_10885 [Armatimonadota bacterium]|nr:hypothetical protein [Armatimonadota bacterium]